MEGSVLVFRGRRSKEVIARGKAVTFVQKSLFCDTHLYFRAQILLFRCLHFHRLANELSGEAYGTELPVATCDMAARILRSKFGHPADIVLPPRFVPIGENTIKFSEPRLSFYPSKIPVLHAKGSKPVHFYSLPNEYGLSGRKKWEDAADLFLSHIRSGE